MPDLGWDIAETQLQETQEKLENNATCTTPCFQLLITVAIIITAILEHIAAYICQRNSQNRKKTAQAVKSMTMKAGSNKLVQNIKDSYKTAALAITIVTSTMNGTNCTKQHQASNRNTSTYPGMQKLNDKYDELYQSHTFGTHHNNCN